MSAGCGYAALYYERSSSLNFRHFRHFLSLRLCRAVSFVVKFFLRKSPSRKETT